MINWQNPYENLSDTWLKGNLHTHTAPQSPCGRVALTEVLKGYEQAKYDFLSISDHQFCTVVDKQTSLILIPGLEWNGRLPQQPVSAVNYREHLGIYSLDRKRVESSLEYYEPATTINALGCEETIIVLNHPNWLIPHHYSEESLFALYEGCDGMEIYNAVIDRHPGTADATMKWDRVLTEKGPILGFASDDSHLESDIGKAFIMVNVNERSVDDIFSNIKQGRFYCSTGLLFNLIDASHKEVSCQLAGSGFIEAVGENGEIFASAENHLSISWQDTPSAYIRFVAHGSAKKQAWTQPFFRLD